MTKKTKNIERFERIAQMDFPEYFRQEKPWEMSPEEARLEYLRIKTATYILQTGTESLEEFVKQQVKQVDDYFS